MPFKSLERHLQGAKRYRSRSLKGTSKTGSDNLLHSEDIKKTE
ncbi:hypothetical protein SAMN04487825_102223 [Prevotella sp. kh1p2]|nr:hypothetical protein SAMN04487825_102223 [Prevotella sp. kh1p2]SNU10447.1 hypothetical protein SAMN06298210_102209 [Prevotellaceae bacterium KH2P17]